MAKKDTEQDNIEADETANGYERAMILQILHHKDQHDIINFKLLWRKNFSLFLPSIVLPPECQPKRVEDSFRVE